MDREIQIATDKIDDNKIFYILNLYLKHSKGLLKW